MRSSFLMIFLLIMVLLVVLAVIFAASHTNFEGSEKMSAGTQTFFEQFVIAGGPIVWFVLLPMSVLTLYLAAEHSLTIRRKKLLPSAIGSRITNVIRQQGPAHLESRIPDGKDFVSVAVRKAVTKGSGDWFRMRSVMAESLQDQALALLRKIEWLNMIGNVSPMVGLFGTVFGMIKLFNAIVITGGQPQPARLAEGISIALVTTFWGLFIAIPALAIHGVFRNRIETLVSDAVVESENIMPQIRRCMKKQNQQETPENTSSTPRPVNKSDGKSSDAIGRSLHSI
jgi:biopolymer transport protein ExbB